MRFRLLLLFVVFSLGNALAQTWIPATEVSFDFSRIRRMEGGPAGHVYALDEKMNLGLIRFDTLPARSGKVVSASLVKVLPLQYWPGYEREKRQFDFSSVSEDGRHIAFTLTSREILRIEPDGTPVLAPPSEEIFLLDFAEQKLEFRRKTQRRTASVFFGQSLRYAEYPDGKCRIMAKDPEEFQPRVVAPLSFGNALSTKHPPRHQSLNNEGFAENEKFEFRDDLQQLAFRLEASRLMVESAAFSPVQISLPVPGDVELFRFREGYLILRQPGDSAFLLNPLNGEIRRGSLGKSDSIRSGDFRSCLFNGSILTGFSKGCFTFCDILTGKTSRSQPLSSKAHQGIPRIALAGNSGVLLWEKSGKTFRFFPRGRTFGFEKTAASEAEPFTFPQLNSKKFRVRTTQFIDDSSAEKTESRFAAGIFLNGVRISSFYGKSIEKFIKLDVSEKTGRAFLSYQQPNIMAIDAACRQIWSATGSSPIRALKADESGKSVLSWSEDGVVDFRNAMTGKKYLSMVFDSSGKEWLLWTPSGYFDASPHGEELLYWMPAASGEKDQFPGLFSMGSLSSHFRKPAVVDAAMLCYDENTALKRLKFAGGKPAEEIRIQQRIPSIYLSFPGDQLFFSAPEVRIPVFQVPGRKPLKILRVWVDGQPRPDVVAVKNGTLAVSLPAKDCLLEIAPVSAAGQGEKIKCRMRWTGKK